MPIPGVLAHQNTLHSAHGLMPARAEDAEWSPLDHNHVMTSHIEHNPHTNVAHAHHHSPAHRQGNFRLPFTMLRVVLDELGHGLSGDRQFLSHNEQKTIAELASELGRLSSRACCVRSDKEDCEIFSDTPLCCNFPDLHDNEVRRSEVRHNTTGESGQSDHDEDRRVVEASGTTLGLSNDITKVRSARSAYPMRDDGLPQDNDLLIRIFKELDVDCSGTLNVNELRRALIEAQVPMARLTKLLRTADVNKSGEIDIEEWMRAIGDSPQSLELNKFMESLLKKVRTGTAGELFQKEKTGFLVLHPASRWRISWDSLILFICAYICMVVPFVLAWEEDVPKSLLKNFDIIDRCIDIIFTIDVFLNFCTGYYTFDGDLIMKHKQIGIRYLKTWFTLDVLSTFPFDDAGLAAGKHLQVFKLLKLGKILKVVKCMAPHQVDLSEISDTLDTLTTSKTWQMINRRANMLIYVILVCHWMACGMKIVDADDIGFLRTYQDGKLYGRVWAEYLVALYWSMTTITTVGYGDISPVSDGERVFTLTAMVVGGGFYGYVVGSICAMVSTSDLNTTAFYDRMELIHAWQSHHKLPFPMRKRLRRYFKIFFREKAAVSESDIWRDLTPELQREVGAYIISDDVVANPLFDGLTMGTVVRLQSILQRVMSLPGRTIAEAGEAGTAMYIIVRGSVNIEHVCEPPADQTLHNTLYPGQSFGEEILLGFVENYEYTITTNERSIFEMILEDDFLNLFTNMPNVLERMRRNATEMRPEWLVNRKSDNASCRMTPSWRLERPSLRNGQ